MKNRVPMITTRFMVVGLLAVAIFVNVPQKIQAAPVPADPAHAAHVASGAMPPDAAKGDPALLQELSQLKAKVAQFEAALAKNAPRASAAPPAAGAMQGMASPPMKPMAGMSSPAPEAMKPGGMGGMNMMGMMDKMMGMMDKMMSMSGGTGMMDMEDKMTMGEMGGGGMGMDKMEMAGMMGMGAMSGGAPGAMPQSALPGFPGASHLYHIGATDFFLDHPQHIALSTEQQAGLNKAKEQALLAKSAADRAIQQAEQELWMLTAADQPDAAKIQAKITEIGKLTGDARLAFIRAVGDASKFLTEEQRKILTGFAPPAPAAAMPAGGMKDM